MKKVLIISATALALVLLLVILIPKKNPKPVATKIEAYLYQREEDKAVILNLTDFTDFTWDKLVVYKCPTTVDEAGNLTEKEYTKVKEVLSKANLSSGMIFLRNEELVHAENYFFDYYELGTFTVYAHKGGGHPHCRTFTLDEAKFEGRVLYKDTKGERYSLCPIE